MRSTLALAVRLAAHAGTSVPEALDAVADAYIGEPGPCRRYGIMLVHRRGDDALDRIAEQLDIAEGQFTPA